jgi:hypothetical protein
MRRRIVLALVAAVATLGVFFALGFGRIREVRGCRSLAAIVNPAIDDISAQMTKPGTAPYRFAARRYKAASSELARFDLGIPRAEKTVDELGSTLAQASTHSATLADALEKRDVVVAAAARRDLVNLARSQKAIAKRIDKDCDGP